MSDFTSKSVVASMVVPPPVELITPSVMSIFSPAVKSHDISLVIASILIFVPACNLSCLSPIKVETLLPFNNIEFVFNELKDQVPSSSILLNSLLNMFSFVGIL